MYIFVYISSLDLIALFKDCYTPSPVPVLLESMFDVREWLAPVNPQLHNISNPHVFFLTKNTNGSVVLRYKQWSLPSKEPNKCIEIIKQVCIIFDKCSTVFLSHSHIILILKTP